MHPGHSPSDIQTHLYTSFLRASTYDVALRVTGTWNAIYKLHRVVLIQSGFFRSLFTGGFSESAVRLVSLRNGTDEISIAFDDVNITRAAFEVCISRLYGGGPPLYVSKSLLPTTQYPLTPPFFGVNEPDVVPVGHHPATPRFMLSLLATAIYLSMPSLASQALSLVLKTVGPMTVKHYLSFACGSSSIHQYVDTEPRDLESAVGLEHVAHMIDDEDSILGLSDINSIASPSEGIKNDSPVDASSEDDNHDSITIRSRGDLQPDDHPSPYYGPVSDKIGEACACWLTRWAVDILSLEVGDTITISPPPESRSRSQSLSSTDSSTFLSSLSLSEKHITPAIWGAGGLQAKWIAAIVASDTLFVKNERERYNFARSVVELRRRDGINEHEETSWVLLFDEGIHYANMTFEDLIFISQDISPTTKRHFVSQRALQSSLWTQSVLRYTITQRAYPSGQQPIGIASSPPSRDKDIGITCTTADILLKLAQSKDEDIDSERVKVYYPVLGDSSLRIGDNGTTPPSNGVPLTMDDLFSPSHSTSPERGSGHATKSPHEISTIEKTFFGIMTRQFDAQRCIDFDPTGKLRWSPYPPFRFSVEFWDVDFLKEKSRLHSQTIWHAGSLFNVYVQLVRKKGQAQLGIYLHRQSHVDPIPASSAPSTPAHGTKEPELLTSLDRIHSRRPSMPSLLTVTSIAQPSSPTHYSPSIHPPRSTTPNYAGSASPPSPPSSPTAASQSFGGSVPSTLLRPAPQQPYRDPRQAVSAYFAISCASATGTSQTRFSSSPDVFSVSQSWGWKSSTLRTEDFVEVGTQTLPANISRGREVSLRATVLLGLV